ncbi:hypothetical protein C7Y47_07725 [Lysinibacillus sphaericus]|uniref:Uncharacterized protein n=1 Tax=Lysinibacillus sphaericus TaxID=1421 RepID=A0A544UMR9_LYSSH|nr:hypothetical protein [Lysinibacillus sp. SDF0037]TQR35133.1 hypothetical protein C7Y47_07725 [Lysinibacillus sp. SDF0037]
MYDSSYYNDFDDLDVVFLIIMLICIALISIASYVISSLIYYQASKVNGFSKLAYIAWIPIIGIYNLFLLTAKGNNDVTVRAAAMKNAIIYAVLTFVSFIPFLFLDAIASIGLLGFIFYITYRLFYRWTGGTGKAVLYTILSVITLGLFYFIYGLIKMNKPFVA